MATIDPHTAEIAEWQAVVGKAIVSFAELELITYKCLAHIPMDQISETSSRLQFSRRVDLIVEILEGRSPLPKAVSDFVAMLRRARELAQIRNDIAHNPVMLNVFVHKVTGDVLLEQSIAAARGNRFIDISSAKELAAAVEDLAASMWLQIGKVAECAAPAWKN